jgi:hypothetical protein
MRIRKFHVSYQWQNKNQSGFGSITISMTGKITEDAVQGFKKCIDEKNPGQSTIILAITELEK